MLSKEICKRCVKECCNFQATWVWSGGDKRWDVDKKILCAENNEDDDSVILSINEPPPNHCRYLLEQTLYHEQTKKK